MLFNFADLRQKHTWRNLRQNTYLEFITSGFICWNCTLYNDQLILWHLPGSKHPAQAEPDFITSDLWPSLNSYDLDSEDYEVWAWYRSASVVYPTLILDVTDLKWCLIRPVFSSMSSMRWWTSGVDGCASVGVRADEVMSDTSSNCSDTLYDLFSIYLFINMHITDNVAWLLSDVTTGLLFRWLPVRHCIKCYKNCCSICNAYKCIKLNVVGCKYAVCCIFCWKLAKSNNIWQSYQNIKRVRFILRHIGSYRIRIRLTARKNMMHWFI